ncbi:MAG: glycosyltransferase family 2 protein [Acidobacteriaceae bacterium]
MPPERPLLTIAIPTYNRSIYLKKLLDELAPQLLHEGRAEILISDNASPDDTPAVVDNFVRMFPGARYVRNPENIGSDANFLQCYNLAQGEYVWIFGDDDVLVEGGLRQILEVLAAREYDMLYVSSRQFRDRYVPPDPGELTGRLMTFSDCSTFALRVGTGLAFISGNILRKSRIEAVLHQDFGEFVGSNLVHLSWTYTLLAQQPKCAIVRDPLVANKTENTGGFGTCKVFGENIHQMAQRILGEHSALGKALINRNLQSFLPWATVQDRSGKSIRNLKEKPEDILHEIYKENFRYWIFLLPILKLPLPLAKAWLFAVRVTNRVDQLLDFPLTRGT